MELQKLDRITFNPAVMGGRACVRNLRITVALILNLFANGMSVKEILNEYSSLQEEDFGACLKYAAWLAK